MFEINIASIDLKNPLMLASGVVGSDISLLIKAWQSGAAAVVTKTYTIEKREGYPTPIIVGLPYGYINAVGLENPGIEHISHLLKSLNQEGIKAIISIAGKNIEEFLRLAMRCAENGAMAVEINLSCPHAKKMGLELGMDQEFVIKLIRKLKEEISIPIFPKFGYMPNLIDTLKLAQIAGADGVVLINTIRAMKINVWIKKPVLSNKFGGLSGPALHPIALYCVYQAYENLDIPIIASGGV
ncbi:MAG: tRNA-dihydrouridine synthase, partial [Candidatus Njordarchaeota archaeon]